MDEGWEHYSIAGNNGPVTQDADKNLQVFQRSTYCLFSVSRTTSSLLRICHFSQVPVKCPPQFHSRVRALLRVSCLAFSLGIF